MRQAAGILMIAFALFMVRDVTFRLTYYGFGLGLLLILLAAASFVIAGGVFCLERRFWKVCFASAVVTVIIMVLLWINESDSVLAWIVSIVGTFPIIFVLLARKGWQRPEASPGSSDGQHLSGGS